jgi:hypothetical protein
MTRAAPEVPHGPLRLEEAEERLELMPPAEQLFTNPVPLPGLGSEESAGPGVSLRENCPESLPIPFGCPAC